jgi:hypothetical protein
MAQGSRSTVHSTREKVKAVQWAVGTWVSAMEVPAVGTLQPASIGMRFMAGKTLYRP